MWFWSADSVEQELFDLYAPALQSLGVNFSDEQLQDTLEASSRNQLSFQYSETRRATPRHSRSIKLLFRRCFQERNRLYTLARRKPQADLPDCDTN